jgi:NhaC family Na+:H+ antiporter
MFGGVMEGSRQLEVIVDRLKKLAKTPASLVTLTEATCVVSNVVMPEQYISIVVPGRMYAEEYGKMKLHPKTLSNALESAGTVTSALVPWNTCGAYMQTTLKTPIWGAGGFGPCAIFNWLMPVMNVILAYLGVSVADKNGVRLRKKKRLAKKAARV